MRFIPAALVVATALFAGQTVAKAKTHNDGDTCNRNQDGVTECSNDKSYIVTCRQDRIWHKAVDCGASGCTAGNYGIPICGSVPSKRDADEDDLVSLRSEPFGTAGLPAYPAQQPPAVPPAEEDETEYETMTIVRKVKKRTAPKINPAEVWHEI